MSDWVHGLMKYNVSNKSQDPVFLEILEDENLYDKGNWKISLSADDKYCFVGSWSTTYGLKIILTYCHYSCEKCFGVNEGECKTCVLDRNKVDTSFCVCPDGKYDDINTQDCLICS